MASNNTKERILDAAGQLFAEQGVDGTSLRALTAAAGVNLAAAHYHFGSKEALLQAVIARRVGPINEERLKRLEQLEAAAGDGPIDLEALLAALLEPPLRAQESLGEHGRLLARLISRVYTDDSEAFQTIVLEQFREVIQRFGLACARSLPELPIEEVFQRLQYVAAVLMHVLADNPRIGTISPVPLPVSDADTTLRRAVTFLAAGMRAPMEPSIPGGAP